MKIAIFILPLAVILSACSAPREQKPAAHTSVAHADYYISSAGNDSNPGTKAKPFATLPAARDAVRKQIANGMEKDLVVQIGAGNFFIDEPVVFDDRDGGQNGFEVIYKGAPDLGTRIYGGRQLRSWKKINDSTYECLTPVETAHYTLYENESAANGGIFHTFDGTEAGNFKVEGTTLTYSPRTLPIEDQVIVLGTCNDVLVLKGRSMKQIVENITFDGLYMIGSDFAEKWKDGATFQTAWDGIYDGKEWGGKLLGDAVPAPDMRHGQFYIENAKRISILNSKLYGAGFMAVMANRYAQETVVENCWIENAGCVGLFYMGWECGRGPFKTPEESDVNKNHLVRNNVFHDIGRFAHDGGGIYMTFSGNNIVEHNIFNGITRYGVALKGWRPQAINLNAYWGPAMGYHWKDPRVLPFDQKHITFYNDYIVTAENQGAELLHARNNIVRYNDLSQIPRHGVDMGMIEMWGAGENNVWEYNACHDGVQSGPWDHWMHVLFNDDGCHYATIRGNLVYWISGGRLSRAIMTKAIEQINCNNIIADCELDRAATVQKYVEDARDMVWSRNIVSSQLKQIYGFPGKELLAEAKNNVYHYKPLGPATTDAKGSASFKEQLDTRIEQDFEQGTLQADPMFVRKNPWWDTNCRDYALRPGSPALKLGFEPIPLEKIGLASGFPFDLDTIFAHSADEIWEAADYSRIYKARIKDGVVCARYDSETIYPGSWVRYSDIDFGDGTLTQFELLATYDALGGTAFAKQYGKRLIKPVPVENNKDPEAIMIWEVSPIYKRAGINGRELLEVAFAPEKKPETVKWKPFTEATTSRATITSKPGVVDIDVFHGEENTESCAYLRASLHAEKGRTNADLKLDCDTGAKVWLNDELLVNGVQDGRILVTLKEGWNTFVVKVAQGTDAKREFKAKLGVTTSACGKLLAIPGLPENFANKDDLAKEEAGNSAIELRLDAPDGNLIGTVEYGANVAEVASVKGRHDLFLVFPNENVRNLDWYIFK